MFVFFPIFFYKQGGEMTWAERNTMLANCCFELSLISINVLTNISYGHGMAGAYWDADIFAPFSKSEVLNLTNEFQRIFDGVTGVEDEVEEGLEPIGFKKKDDQGGCWKVASINNDGSRQWNELEGEEMFKFKGERSLDDPTKLFVRHLLAMISRSPSPRQEDISTSTKAQYQIIVGNEAARFKNNVLAYQGPKKKGKYLGVEKSGNKYRGTLSVNGETFLTSTVHNAETAAIGYDMLVAAMAERAGVPCRDRWLNFSGGFQTDDDRNRHFSNAQEAEKAAVEAKARKKRQTKTNGFYPGLKKKNKKWRYHFTYNGTGAITKPFVSQKDAAIAFDQLIVNYDWCSDALFKLHYPDMFQTNEERDQYLSNI